MAIKDTLASVRTQIKANVTAGVPASVPVYDYFRDIRDEETRKTLGLDGSSVFHLWMLGLDQDQPDMLVTRGANTEGFFRFALHGYLRIDDAAASEKTFDAECCDVQDAFRVDKHLAGLAIDAWPVSRVQGGWVKLADVPCHYAKLIVTARVVVEC